MIIFRARVTGAAARWSHSRRLYRRRGAWARPSADEERDRPPSRGAAAAGPHSFARLAVAAMLTCPVSLAGPRRPLGAIRSAPASASVPVCGVVRGAVSISAASRRGSRCLCVLSGHARRAASGRHAPARVLARVSACSPSLTQRFGGLLPLHDLRRPARAAV